MISAKVSRVQDVVAVYRALADRSAYALHVGLTEAGMGIKGIAASAAALALLLQDGIGDTIRASLTPRPDEPRTNEVVACQEVLQSLGLRSFTPQVTACPGCGRTTSTLFQELALSIQTWLRDQMPVWQQDYPGVESLNVAVMGCIVNGPGESKHADIGISLPGTGESPTAPVFIDGKKAHTLRGAGSPKSSRPSSRPMSSAATAVPSSTPDFLNPRQNRIMSQLRPARGTHDLLGDEARRHRHVAETGRAIAGRYGYGEIATPIFEFTEVFQRTLGETSDIVTKEMYTFEDRGGDRVTLRPENTAGVVRAVITGGLTQELPQKFYYHGPMFRYERPQKGRLRQFHQIGVELIGAGEPMADVEVIAVGAHILETLGVLPHTVLELNTLGDRESRLAYREVLVRYLEGHQGAPVARQPDPARA